MGVLKNEFVQTRANYDRFETFITWFLPFALSKEKEKKMLSMLSLWLLLTKENQYKKEADKIGRSDNKSNH